MAWKVEFSQAADKYLRKLDPQHRQRILKFLSMRIAGEENPRRIGQGLQGARFGEFWKYRVGDYRLICKIEDDQVLVLVLQVGHRREVYR
jgi:mRNA interferase RelE/StbE